MQFDKVVAKKLRDELNEAVQSVAKKYDLTILVGSCRFSQTEIKYGLEVKTNDTGAIESKAREEWNNYCKLIGFTPEQFGANFKVRGEEYKIVGFNLRKSKFDLSAKRVSDGKVFGFRSEDIIKCLAFQGGENVK